MLTSILLSPPNQRPPNTNNAATTRITKITRTAMIPVLAVLLVSSAISFFSLLSDQLPHLGRGCFASEQRQNFSSDVTRIYFRREINKSRRDLFGLSRPLHRRVCSKLRYVFRFLVRRIERCPNWSRRNAVHANAALHQVLGQRLRECVNGAFGRRVIEQLFASLETRD